jgi:hypothetical protein
MSRYHIFQKGIGHSRNTRLRCRMVNRIRGRCLMEKMDACGSLRRGIARSAANGVLVPKRERFLCSLQAA